MKYIRPFIVTFILLFLFPVLSNADEYDDALTALSNKDYAKAIGMLVPLTDENNLGAKTLLGLLYFKGEGVEQDVKKGLSMIMDAANQGYEPAQTNAVALTGELARLGEPSAMYNAGYMCMKGWGGEQDPNTCVRLIEKAAESGHVKSAKVLVGIYSKGKFGIAPNKEKVSYYSSLTHQSTTPQQTAGDIEE